MSHRLRTLGLVTMAALPVILAGCAGSSPTNSTLPSGGNVVTLTYGNFTAATIPGEAKLITQFEATHPNIKIKLLELPLDNYQNNLQLGVRTKKNPDVFEAIPEWLNDFHKYNVLTDLTPTDKVEYEKRFLPIGLQSVSLEGHLYGAPFRVGESAVFVNPALFKAAGIPIPRSWTWDGFWATAKKLTDPSKQQYGFAVPVSSAQSDLGSSWTWLTYLFSNGGQMVGGGKASINNAAGVAALNNYIKPYKAGIEPRQQLSWGTNDVVQAFGQGKVAMWLNGPWYISTIETSFPKFDFKVVPLPTGTTYGSAAGGTFIGISSQTSHPAEAREFVNYMTSEAVLSKWAQEGQFLPPVKSILSTPPFQTDKLKPFSDHLEEPGMVVTGLTPSNTALMSSLQAAIESAMSGATSPKAALDQAAQTWNAKLAG